MTGRNLTERMASAALNVVLSRLSTARPDHAQAAWTRLEPSLRAVLAAPWLGFPSDMDRDERLANLVADIHAEPRFLSHVRSYTRNLTCGDPHESLQGTDQVWTYPMFLGDRPLGAHVVVAPGDPITFAAIDA